MPSSASGRIRRRRFIAASAGALSVPLLIGGGALTVRAFTQDSDRPSPASNSIPDVAEIRCDPAGGVEAPEQVRVQPDGVHFRFVPLPGVKIVRGHLSPSGKGLTAEITARPFRRVDATEGAGPLWFACVTGKVVPQFIFEVEKSAEGSSPQNSLEAHFERVEVVAPN